MRLSDDCTVAPGVTEARHCEPLQEMLAAIPVFEVVLQPSYNISPDREHGALFAHA
jgi:hypothetical protein